MSASKTVVLITGSSGWLGGLLVNELLADPETPNCHLILADVVEPKAPQGASALTLKADLTIKDEIDQLFKTEYGTPDVIYALHGIMSRGSEDDFDHGVKVNVDSMRLLLDKARHEGAAAGKLIRYIFASSLAVYGGPLPDVVTPTTIATPEGAYGMGKLSTELFVNEYSRRGFVDGIIMRLPTIVVRPGVPSNATSAFLSGIIREPLKGIEATCPIGDSFDSYELDKLRAWVASPETTIRNFVKASHVRAEKLLPHTRVICLPGFTASVRDELNALREVAGDEALKLVKFEDNPTNRRIVSSWPAAFDNTYPLSLGFIADEGGMVPVVRKFKADVEAGIA